MVGGLPDAEQKQLFRLQAPDTSELFDSKSGEGTIIRLARDSDLSMFLHETEHLWLKELIEDAADPAAPDGLKDDLGTVLKWLGAKDASEITTEQHEKFARGFETYAMEGRAPSTALAAAFQKFKTWLTRIYRSIRTLGAPIDDRVRGVMDRLLASDDEISRARALEGLNPLFPDAKSAGMTNAEYRAYTSGVKRARAAADEKLLARTMAAIRKQRETEWKSERETVLGEVAGEMNSRPDFRAWSFLKTGELPETEAADEAPREPLQPFKLDRRAVVDLYGTEGALDQLPRGVYAREGGVDPEEAAPFFGYRSGDAMLRELMSLENLRRQAVEQTGKKRLDILGHLIDREADDRMLERHGDLLNDGSIEDEALAAIHSNEQASVLAVELKALGRQLGTEPLTIDAMRRWAEGQIADEPARRASNWQRYARTEAKVSRETERALLKGDVAAAFQAKQRQILGHLMTQAAKDASDDWEKLNSLVDRYTAKASFPSIDQEYMNRLQALLGQLGRPARRDPAELQRAIGSESLEGWLSGKIADGHEIVMPSFLLGGFGKPFDALTVDEARGLKGAIESLVHNGRNEKSFFIDGQRAERAALWKEAAEQFDGLKQRKASATYDPSKASKIASTFRSLDGSLLKPEQILDWADHDDPNGVFNRVVMRPLTVYTTMLPLLRKPVVHRISP